MPIWILTLIRRCLQHFLREYREEVPAKYLPPMYQTIDTLYNGNEQAYIDTLYARSEITSPRGLKRFLERDTTFNIIDDPAILVRYRPYCGLL